MDQNLNKYKPNSYPNIPFKIIQPKQFPPYPQAPHYQSLVGLRNPPNCVPLANQQTNSNFQGIYNSYLQNIWSYYSQSMANNEMKGTFPFSTPTKPQRSHLKSQNNKKEVPNSNSNGMKQSKFDIQQLPEDHILVDQGEASSDPIYTENAELLKNIDSRPNQRHSKWKNTIGLVNFPSTNRGQRRRKSRAGGTRTKGYLQFTGNTVKETDQSDLSQDISYQAKNTVKKAAFEESLVKNNQAIKANQPIQLQQNKFKHLLLRKQEENPLKFVNKVQQYIQNYKDNNSEDRENSDKNTKIFSIQQAESLHKVNSKKQNKLIQRSFAQTALTAPSANAEKYLKYSRLKQKKLTKTYEVSCLEDTCSSEKEFYMFIQSQIIGRVWLSRGHGFQQLKQYMDENGVKFFTHRRYSVSFKNIQFYPSTKYNSKCEIICRMMAEMVEFFLQNECRATIHKITEEELLCLLPYLLHFQQTFQRNNVQTLINLMNVVLALKKATLTLEKVQSLYLSLMGIIEQKFPKVISRGTKPFMNVTKFNNSDIVLFLRQSIKKYTLNQMMRISPKFKKIWKNQIEKQFAKLYLQYHNKYSIQTFGCCLHLKNKYPQFQFYFTTFYLRHFFLKRVILKSIRKLKQTIADWREKLPIMTYLGSQRAKDIVRKKGYKKLRGLFVMFYLQAEYSVSKLCSYIEEINSQIRRQQRERSLFLIADASYGSQWGQLNKIAMELQNMQETGAQPFKNSANKELRRLSNYESRRRFRQKLVQEDDEQNQLSNIQQSEEQKTQQKFQKYLSNQKNQRAKGGSAENQQNKQGQSEIQQKGLKGSKK